MNFNGEKRYQRFVELSREREELFRKKLIMETIPDDFDLQIQWSNYGKDKKYKGAGFLYLGESKVLDRFPGNPEVVKCGDGKAAQKLFYSFFDDITDRLCIVNAEIASIMENSHLGKEKISGE